MIIPAPLQGGDCFKPLVPRKHFEPAQPENHLGGSGTYSSVGRRIQNKVVFQQSTDLNIRQADKFGKFVRLDLTISFMT